MSFTPPARGIKDYALPFLIIVALGVAIVLAFRLYSILQGGGSLTESLDNAGKAALTVSTGDVEAYLPASSAWKIIDSTVTLSAGESVRTGSDGVATLTFDDGSTLKLDHGSEVALTELQNSLTKKIVTLTLVRGNVQFLATQNNALKIQTDLLSVSDLEGQVFVFNDTTAKQIQLAIVNGAAIGAVLDPQNTNKPEIKRLAVESGKTLTVSERRINLLRIGGEISLVEPTPTEILQTPFYVANTSTATPAMSNDVMLDQLLADDTTTALKTSEVTSIPTTLSAPVVTSFVGNELKTSVDKLVITGTVSPLATKIEVAYNSATPYALQKFIASSSKWSYNVGTALGNLQSGKNTYTVTALDKDGVRSPSTIFTITYTPKEQTAGQTSMSSVESPGSQTVTSSPMTTPTLPALSPTIVTIPSIPTVGGEVFAAPVVTTPANGETYTTGPIRFTGTVSPSTASITVNGYALTKFTAGSTTWYYTADAQYNNLQSGDNEYEITATSDTGVQKSVTVKIKYTPEVNE